MSNLKPILSDEILSKYSKDKQIALLKVERNTYIATQNVGDVFIGWAVKCGIMAQGMAQIQTIIQAKEE